MNRSLLLGFASGVLLMAIPLFLVVVGPTGSPQGTDGRTQVPMTPQEHDMVRLEMRMILEALQRALAAVDAGDGAAAAAAMDSIGTGMVKELSALHPTILPKLPPPMKALGLGVHADVDRLSAAFSGGNTDPAFVVHELSLTLTKCTTCHGSYRIVDEQAPADP